MFFRHQEKGFTMLELLTVIIIMYLTVNCHTEEKSNGVTT
ncbi:MAG: type II secretion system protein [Lentimicrobiaceae bacterium]|nr:type II secretion system protein [Lentimicrobiaceae bacterium]